MSVVNNTEETHDLSSQNFDREMDIDTEISEFVKLIKNENCLYRRALLALLRSNKKKPFKRGSLMSKLRYWLLSFGYAILAGHEQYRVFIEIRNTHRFINGKKS